ncbi:MAG TPA: MauE/DoxX family redox-associated membrane protein [Bryobacteraceae bacterium]|nr:MauE/DoxX family redox-associated membrane protein [Bryobacteraceae bacterium]
MAVSAEHFGSMQESRGWLTAINWTSAVLMTVVFLVAGLWKITDPIGAAARLAQARVPESLSVFTATTLGTVEVFTGILLLIPAFRKWGSLLGSILMVAFMAFIGYHYKELTGAECSCFPWIKRAVGPGFFIGDGIMLLLAIGAGIGARPAAGVRRALLILAGIGVFTASSYGYALTRHTGVKAPDTLTAQDGRQVSINTGKVFIYFFNPQCLHCLDAGRKLAALNWGDTRFVGVPTENPQFADWFMGKAGLTGKGPVVKDLDTLKKLFPFDLPPAGVALQDGYEKAMLLQFEDEKEPSATLTKLGFVH